MRGRSSSKKAKISRIGVSMEKDKVDKVKEEPHLSGAYIRSLVKHLTSTRTKDLVNGDTNLPQILKADGECFSEHNNMQQELSSASPPPPQPPHKKQVRRRQHTTRPYQERLLNMAEARKEIVTALKFHRASKQESANNPDLKASSQTHPQSEQSPYTTTNTNLSNHYSGLSCPPSIPYYWPVPTISPPPLPPAYHDNINFALPNQTLGLNLNFQDFKNLDTNLYHTPLSNSSSLSSTTSSSSSSSSSMSTSSSAAISEVAVPNSSSGSDLHHAMDEEEMEEIRSLGEQHQMEWNDRVNLVKSARWFKFLKTIEIGPEDVEVDDKFNLFDQVTEFPSWLINANECSGLQKHVVYDHFLDDYLQDPALNCMDIGEIEEMDGEWLL